MQRFGFITTNSLRQTFNRRVAEAHLKGTISETPKQQQSAANREKGERDHPGRSVGHPAGHMLDVPIENDAPSQVGPSDSGRMPKPATKMVALPVPFAFSHADASSSPSATPLSLHFAIPGTHEGELQTVTAEEPHEDGSSVVTLDVKKGRIAANITTGADASAIKGLKANDGMSNPGVKLHGAGFIVTRAKALDLGLHAVPRRETHLREYQNGKDLTDKPRSVLVIDLFGLSSDEVRQRFPAVYQHVLTFVKPERDSNKRESRRKNWWIFGEPNKELRRMLYGLPGYIVTVETSKHRMFQFLDASILPDNMLIAIALDDAFLLGVLAAESTSSFP